MHWKVSISILWATNNSIQQQQQQQQQCFIYSNTKRHNYITSDKTTVT